MIKCTAVHNKDASWKDLWSCAAQSGANLSLAAMGLIPAGNHRLTELWGDSVHARTKRAQSDDSLIG